MLRKPKLPEPSLRDVAREAINTHPPTDSATALEVIRRRVKASPKLLEEAVALAASRAFDLEVCKAYWAERRKG